MTRKAAAVATRPGRLRLRAAVVLPRLSRLPAQRHAWNALGSPSPWDWTQCLLQTGCLHCKCGICTRPSPSYPSYSSLRGRVGAAHVGVIPGDVSVATPQPPRCVCVFECEGIRMCIFATRGHYVPIKYMHCCVVGICVCDARVTCQKKSLLANSGKWALPRNVKTPPLTSFCQSCYHSHWNSIRFL